jgi:hypothetical protein
MIKKLDDDLTVENFKEYILEIEKENSKRLIKDDQKQMVAGIIRNYEEAEKNDNH